MTKNGKFFELLAVRVSAGESILSASEATGCSRSHAYTLSSSPDFRQRVAEIRSEFTSRAVGKLADSASQACETLAELLGSTFEPSIRLNAAKAILNCMPTLSEFGELRSRLDRLESTAKLKVAR